MRANKLWYLFSDLEIFSNVGQELEERYSSRIRLRFAVGYKLSSNWRFEAIYNYQYSQNTITGEFENQDEDILRLRVRYAIN